MSVLSDGEIAEALEEGELGIVGYADLDLQIQPSTLDLRLGNTYKKYYEWVTDVDPEMEDQEDLMEEFTVDDGEKILLDPDDFILGTTIESISLSPRIQGQVKGRSSYGRYGIEVHSTAGLIDPGWEGQITLEISNNTESTIHLTPGKRICQLSFTWLGRAAERPYGERGDSKYHGQQGVTASRAHRDPE